MLYGSNPLGLLEFLLFLSALPIAIGLALLAVVLAFNTNTRKASWLFAAGCLGFCASVILLGLVNGSSNSSSSQDAWAGLIRFFGKLAVPMIVASVVCWFDSRALKKIGKHDHDG